MPQFLLILKPLLKQNVDLIIMAKKHNIMVRFYLGFPVCQAQYCGLYQLYLNSSFQKSYEVVIIGMLLIFKKSRF